MTDYNQLEDGLLLRLVAESDQGAFSELFARYRSKLYDYLFDITRNREIAEELLLDVYLKLWLGRELAPQIHHLDAFLQKVALNKALNFIRIAAKKKYLQKLVIYEMTQRAESTPDDILADKEYQALLQEALDQLSQQRRLIFVMSREQGLSHEEIARELQLSRQTVKNNMSDALKTIREFLSSQKNDMGLLILLLLIHA